MSLEGPHHEPDVFPGLSSVTGSRAKAAHLPAQYSQPPRRPQRYMRAGTCHDLSARNELQAVSHRVATSLY